MQKIRKKINLFRKSLKLVWESSPGWASANLFVSVVRSFLPLVLVWLLKMLIDYITGAASTGSGINTGNVIRMIIAVVAVYFLDEAATDISN